MEHSVYDLINKEFEVTQKILNIIFPYLSELFFQSQDILDVLESDCNKNTYIKDNFRKKVKQLLSDTKHCYAASNRTHADHVGISSYFGCRLIGLMMDARTHGINGVEEGIVPKKMTIFEKSFLISLRTLTSKKKA